MTTTMSTVEPKSGYLTVNGCTLHYLDWGGSGDPIVILHATGFLGRVYAPIAEELRRIGHVYSCDQRGHGDSSPAPDGRYDWQTMIEDLEGFITAMGFKAVRGFGHSAGATAIGSLASERPDLISRAVLADPVLFQPRTTSELGWRHPFVERTLKRRRTFASVHAMYENFRHKRPFATWDHRALHDYCEYGTRPTADGRRELKCAPETEARLYDTAREFDGLGRILRAQVPLLVLVGDHEDSVSKKLADRIASELLHGRVVIVPGTGHFMPMEKPAAVAQIALEFLG